GLAEIESDVLIQQPHKPMLVAAFFEALQTLEREFPDLFPASRLRQIALRGMEHAETADLSIGFLASRRDWQALPNVTNVLQYPDTNSDRQRALHVAVVQYLLECERDTDASTGARAQATRM